MSSPHLLRLSQHEPLLSHGGVVVFGVPGEHRRGPTLLVQSPVLRFHLEEVADEVERVVFIEGSAPNAATLATISAMLSAMGAEDGLVRFEMAAEAVKLTRDPQIDRTTPGARLLIHRGVDRSTVVSFRPPEALRVSAILAALATTPSESWVNPAGLVVANGGRIETYPRIPSNH